MTNFNKVPSAVPDDPSAAVTTVRTANTPATAVTLSPLPQGKRIAAFLHIIIAVLTLRHTFEI